MTDDMLMTLGVAHMGDRISLRSVCATMSSMFVLLFVSLFFGGGVVVYYNDTPIGADRINNEVKQVFSPGCSTSSSCSSSMLFIARKVLPFATFHYTEMTSTSTPDVLHRANAIVEKLRSNPYNGRKRRAQNHHAVKAVKSFQKNVVLIDYPGDIGWDASTLYESNKIFDGPIRYDSEFMEIDFRRRIASSINKKI